MLKEDLIIMGSTKKDDTITAEGGIELHPESFDFIGYSTTDGLKLLLKNSKTGKFYTIKFGKHSWQDKGLNEAFADAKPGSFRFDYRPEKQLSANLLVDQYGCPHLDSEAAASGIGSISNAIFYYSQRGNAKTMDGDYGLTEDAVSVEK
jgi:hypothetical protein